MSARNFWFGADGRLRAGWRIMLFCIVTAGLFVVCNMLTSALWFRWYPGGIADRVALSLGQEPSVASMAVYSVSGIIALLLSHAIALRWLNGTRSWTPVGLGREQAAPSVLVVGLLMGALAIGVPSLLLLLMHRLQVTPAAPGSWWNGALQATLLLVPAAFLEELALRGYLFATLREAIGWKWTLMVTSVVFGLLHLQNPGADAESTMLVIVAGFFLGAILLATKSLYAAWMAHFAWNWVMAGALHTAVSGRGLPMPDYTVVDAGPSWLTGGAWGPEGGAAAGVSMLACFAYVYARYLKRTAM